MVQSQKKRFGETTDQSAESTSVESNKAKGIFDDNKVIDNPHCHDANVEGPRLDSQELLLSVRVYKPFSSQYYCYKVGLLGEFTLLGRHTLADLRDLILCEFDYASLAGDLSMDPSQVSKGLPLAKQAYPSGFFFINDQFHDDMRNEDSKRLSENTLECAKGSDSLNFTRGLDMVDQKLENLYIKVGYPYLYVHQGTFSLNIFDFFGLSFSFS